MTNSETRETPPTGLPDEFLQGLGQRFGFDAAAPELRRELDDIARRYSRDVRLWGREAETLAALRRDYRDLRRQAESLRQTLASDKYAGLAEDITLTLRLRPPEPPLEGFGPFPAPRGEIGEHLLTTLAGLLDLLTETADTMEGQLAAPKGRPRDHALESLMRRLAFVWAHILKQPFTLDYHQGSALTEAGEFVSAFATQIDPEITQTRIITAMRTIISERNRKKKSRA